MQHEDDRDSFSAVPELVLPRVLRAAWQPVIEAALRSGARSTGTGIVKNLGAAS